ncbi:22274_t:CDS:2, partial [Dentiscutata erythropus]
MKVSTIPKLAPNYVPTPMMIFNKGSNEDSNSETHMEEEKINSNKDSNSETHMEEKRI